MKTLLMKLIGLYINTMAVIAPRYAERFGLALFCRPLRGQMTARQREFLQTASQFSFDFQQEKLAGYRWGNGSKKILLIHGWQSHTYRWKVYIEQLMKLDYSIYAFDAPGHGLSTGNFLSVPLYGDALEKMINQIGRPDAMVSHSLGGFSALYALYKNPSLSPDKLVVMAAPGEASEFFDFYRTALSLSQRSLDLIVKRFKDRFDNGPEYFSASRFASKVMCSGLIIHDALDDETSAEHSQRVHAQWPNSTLHITRGLGHNLKSMDVVKEVIRFVEVPAFSSFDAKSTIPL